MTAGLHAEKVQDQTQIMFLQKTSPKEGRPRGLQGQAMRGDRALTYAWVEQTTTDTFLPLLTFGIILRMAVT